MNRITRNLALVLLGVVCSLITAAILVFVELRTGQALFSYLAWTYVPVGAIAAGLVAAAGFYGGSHLLRLRPPRLMLIAMIAIAAGSVYVMDTVEFGLMTFNRKNVSSTAALGRFLTYSFANSPLRVTSGGSGGSDDEASGSSSSSFRASPVDVSIAGDSNAGVQGIGGGVQGMLATGNALSADNISASLSGAQQRIRGIKSFGAGVLSHDVVIELAVLQWIGFTIGSLLVFYRLRALSYCDDCQVLLSKRGEQTRYFDRERDIQISVDEFLSRAKARRFRQSVEAHAEEGASEKKTTSAFSSTVEIRRCSACHTNRLKFSARRKAGITWKDISMLGYTAFCLEPIEVIRGMRNVSPTRIR